MTRLFLLTLFFIISSILPTKAESLDSYVPPPMFGESQGVITNFDDDVSLVRIYQEPEIIQKTDVPSVKVIQVPPPSIVHVPKTKSQPKVLAQTSKVQKILHKIDGGYLIEPNVQDILKQIHPQ